MVNEKKDGQDRTNRGALSSMTGFASHEGQGAGLSWLWEMRSVNARGLDIRLRLPDGLGALEPQLRKAVSADLARGSVNLSLRLTREDGGGESTLDTGALAGVLDAIAQVQAAAEARGVRLSDPSPADILSMRALSDAGRSDKPEPEALMADLPSLMEAFSTMRAREGAALKTVLGQQIDRIADLTDAANAAAEARRAAQAETFRANVAKVIEAAEVDEARIAQELALIAVKADVTEEIDRLHAHVSAARELLDTGGPVGRKLDFLMQEFNREANTLASKSGDVELTRCALDLKYAIDQMREQVQNVE